MSGEIHSLFGRMVPHGEVKECIAELEDALRCMKKTGYHSLLGKSFLHQAEGMAQFLVSFLEQSKGQGRIRAIYVEMNGFDINTDLWFCNVFGSLKGGNAFDLVWDLEWASECTYVSEEFVLTGMEKTQQAFQATNELTRRRKRVPLAIHIAREVAECLITARFCEMMAIAHRKAKKTCKAIRGLPVVATAHGWDDASVSK